MNAVRKDIKGHIFGNNTLQRELRSNSSNWISRQAGNERPFFDPHQKASPTASQTSHSSSAAGKQNVIVAILLSLHGRLYTVTPRPAMVGAVGYRILEYHTFN